MLAVDALQNVVMRLYGPRTGGQINAANLASFSFLDLKYYLDDNKDKIPPNLADSLKLADWVVVALIDRDPTRPESEAFRQLLANRPELLRNKKVVVFAFGSPFTLDATDISKLSAYYALYSKTPPFLEVAARILFQELPPAGALPVSVAGAGYDLAIALSPDPNQVISLEVDLPPSAATTPQGTQTATPNPAVTPAGNIDACPYGECWGYAAFAHRGHLRSQSKAGAGWNTGYFHFHDTGWRKQCISTNHCHHAEWDRQSILPHPIWQFIGSARGQRAGAYLKTTADQYYFQRRGNHCAGAHRNQHSHRNDHSNNDIHPDPHRDTLTFSHAAAAASPGYRGLVLIPAGSVGRRGRLFLAGPRDQLAALGGALGTAGSRGRAAGLHLSGSRFAWRPGVIGVKRDGYFSVADLIRLIIGLVGRFYLAAAGSRSKKTILTINIYPISLTNFPGT